MIANTLPEFHGFRSGICDDVAVRLLTWSSTYQPYISKDIDSQPGSSIWSVRSIWSIQSVSCVWLNETNQTNQIDQTDQTDQTDQRDQTVQNRAERPMPTLVFLMELGSKLSLRLERCTSTIP